MNCLKRDDMRFRSIWGTGFHDVSGPRAPSRHNEGCVHRRIIIDTGARWLRRPIHHGQPAISVGNIEQHRKRCHADFKHSQTLQPIR